MNNTGTDSIAMATGDGYALPGAVELAAALADDLDGCFDHLVLTYGDRLYVFALRLTASSQDAEEIVQDAFVRAYRALGTYPGEQIRTLVLRPWLYQITLNVFRNRVRNRQLQLVPLDQIADDRPLAELDTGMEQPEAAWERAERSQELSLLVASLPERYRAAVILRHIEGFDYTELATLLNQPVGTVKSNVHRGIRILRQLLQNQMEEVR